MTEAQYEAKFQEMQKHIPFIQKVIEKLKVGNGQQGDNPRKAQLQKMEMLHELLTNRAKKLKMETLMKCEGVLIKLQAKIEKHSTFLQNEDPLLKTADSTKSKVATTSSTSLLTSRSEASKNTSITSSTSLAVSTSQASKNICNEKTVASAPASPSPERIVDDDDIQPVVIPTERRDSPIEILDRHKPASSIGGGKIKDYKQSLQHDHHSYRSPHSQSRHQSRDSPKPEEHRRPQDVRERMPQVEGNEIRHGHPTSSTPPKLHYYRPPTDISKSCPSEEFPTLPPPLRFTKEVHNPSSKSHTPAHKKELSSSSLPSKPASKLNSTQTLQTVKVVITEPLPANIAKQHFPPHHQYRYQHTQHSPTRFLHNIEMLPQSKSPGSDKKSPIEEAYNPDESWEKYNEAQKNTKNQSVSKPIFLRLGDKIAGGEPNSSALVNIPARSNTPIPEVLKSPPLSVNDINNLLIESGGDQITCDISEIGTRRAKKPDISECKNSLDFVRRKFAQIAKINSPQMGDSSPSSPVVKIEEKTCSTPTSNNVAGLHNERLALKYNPHPRQERLQSLSSNDGSECSLQTLSRVGASPSDPRLKLKAQTSPNIIPPLPTGVNVLPSINNNDPRLKRQSQMGNNAVPVLCNAIAQPLPPVNTFAVRSDPRISRQQSLQQATAAPFAQKSPIRRLSISQSHVTPGENRDSDSATAPTEEQSPIRILSVSQPNITPEENWDSDPEEPRKTDINFRRSDIPRQSSASLKKPIPPINREGMCQPRDVPLASKDFGRDVSAVLKDFHCAPVAREKRWESRPEVVTAIPQMTVTGQTLGQGFTSYGLQTKPQTVPFLTNPYVKPPAALLPTPSIPPLTSVAPHPPPGLAPFMSTLVAPPVNRFNSTLNDNTERLKYFEARQQKAQQPRTYKEFREAREEANRRAMIAQAKAQRKMGCIEVGRRKFEEEKSKKLQEQEKSKSKMEDHLHKLEEKRTGAIKDDARNKNPTKAVAGESTLDKMYRTQNFNTQFPKATISFKIPKKKTEEPQSKSIPETKDTKEIQKKPEDKIKPTTVKVGNKSQEKTDKNEKSKKTAGQKSVLSETSDNKIDKSRTDPPNNTDNKESNEDISQIPQEVNKTASDKSVNKRDPRCRKKNIQEEIEIEETKSFKHEEKKTSTISKENVMEKDTDSKAANGNNAKKNSPIVGNTKSFDDWNSLNVSSPNTPEFKPQRILRRRCTMVAIGSEPLVDKDKLMKANALMLEDIEEREKLRRKKEEEERQTARRNKHLAEIFQKTDDNCSVSTQNIITGKRRTRASINFNETQNALKIFKHKTMPTASAAAPPSSSAASTKTTRSRTRPTKATGAHDVTSEKEEENVFADNEEHQLVTKSKDVREESNKKRLCTTGGTDAKSNNNKATDNADSTISKSEDVKISAVLEDDNQPSQTEDREDSKDEPKDKDEKKLKREGTTSTKSVLKKTDRKITEGAITKVALESNKQRQGNSKNKPCTKTSESEATLVKVKARLTDNSGKASTASTAVIPVLSATAAGGTEAVPSISEAKVTTPKHLEDEHQNCAVSSTSAEILPLEETPSTSSAAQRLKKEDVNDNEPSSTASKSSNVTPTLPEDETSRHAFLNEFVQEITKPNADKQHILSLLSQILSEDKLQFIKTVIDSTNKEESEVKDEKIQKAASTENQPKKNQVAKIMKDDDESAAEEEESDDDQKPSTLQRKKISRCGRKKRNELDRLNEDIRDMFICEGVLTATGKRMCTLMQTSDKKEAELETSVGRRSTSSTSQPQSKAEIDPGSEGSAKRQIVRPKRSKAQPLRRSLRACKITENSTNSSIIEEVEVTTYNELRDHSKSNDKDSVPSRRKMPILKPHTPIKLSEEIEIQEGTDTESNSAKRKSVNKPCPKSKKLKIGKQSKEDDDLESSSDSQTQSEGDTGGEIAEFSQMGNMKNTNVHWHNQSKYTTWCMLCSKKIVAISSSFHYKMHHGENFISRLAPILLQKFKQGKLSHPLFGVDRSPKQISWFYRCPFCLQYFNTPMPLWLEHFQNHTAEFRYECSKCHWGSNRIATTRRHISSSCKGATIVNSMVKLAVPSQIKAQVCHLCNFVQLKRANLERHYVEQHQLGIKNVDILGYTITLFDCGGVELVPEDKAQTKEDEIRKLIEVEERIIELEDEKEEDESLQLIETETKKDDDKEKTTSTENNVDDPSIRKAEAMQDIANDEDNREDVGKDGTNNLEEAREREQSKANAEPTSKDTRKSAENQSEAAVDAVVDSKVTSKPEEAAEKPIEANKSVADQTDVVKAPQIEAVEENLSENKSLGSAEISMEGNVEDQPHAVEIFPPVKTPESDNVERIVKETTQKECNNVEVKQTEVRINKNLEEVKLTSSTKLPSVAVKQTEVDTLEKEHQNGTVNQHFNQQIKTTLSVFIKQPGELLPQSEKNANEPSENKRDDDDVKQEEEKRTQPQSQENAIPPKDLPSASANQTVMELSKQDNAVTSAIQNKLQTSEIKQTAVEQIDNATETIPMHNKVDQTETASSQTYVTNSSGPVAKTTGMQEDRKQKELLQIVKADGEVTSQKKANFKAVKKPVVVLTKLGEKVNASLSKKILKEAAKDSEISNNPIPEKVTKTNPQKQLVSEKDKLSVPEKSTTATPKNNPASEITKQPSVELIQPEKPAQTTLKNKPPYEEITLPEQTVISPLNTKQTDLSKSECSATVSSKKKQVVENVKSTEGGMPDLAEAVNASPIKETAAEDVEQIKLLANTTPTKKSLSKVADRSKVKVLPSDESTNNESQQKAELVPSQKVANTTPKRKLPSREVNKTATELHVAEKTISSSKAQGKPADLEKPVISQKKVLAESSDSNPELSPLKFNAQKVISTYSRKRVNEKNLTTTNSSDDCVIVDEDSNIKYLQDELLTLAAKAANEEEKREKQVRTTDVLVDSSKPVDNNPNIDIAFANTKMSDLISNSIDMFYQRNKRKSNDKIEESQPKKSCHNQTAIPMTSNAFIPSALGGTDSPPIQILAQSIISIDDVERSDSGMTQKPQTSSIAERLSQRFKILQEKANGVKDANNSKDKTVSENANARYSELVKLTVGNEEPAEIGVMVSETKELKKSSADEINVISDDEDWEDIEITETAPITVSSTNLQKAKNKGLFQKFGLFKGNSAKVKKNAPPLVFLPKKKAKDKPVTLSSPITAKTTTGNTGGDKANYILPTVHLGFKPVINIIEDLLPDSPCNDPIDLVPELTPLEPLTDLNDISSILDSNLSINIDESQTCIQDALDFVSEQQAHEYHPQKPSSIEMKTKTHTNKIQHVGYSQQSQAINSIKFYCLLENCSFLFSSDAMGLENHFLCEHSQIKWNGFCSMCQAQCMTNDQEYSIVKEIKHMVDSHINKPHTLETNSNDSNQHSLNMNQVAEDRPRIKLRRMTGDCLSTSNSESSTPSGGTTAGRVASPLATATTAASSNTLLGALLNAKQKPPTKEMPPQPEMPLTEPLLMDDDKFCNTGNNFLTTSVATAVQSPVTMPPNDCSLQIASVMSLNQDDTDKRLNPALPKIPNVCTLDSKNVGSFWAHQIEQEKQDMIDSTATSLEVSEILANAGRPSMRREATRAQDESPGPVIVSETLPVAQAKTGDFVITQTVSAQYDSNASAAVGFNISIEVPAVSINALNNSAQHVPIAEVTAPSTSKGLNSSLPLVRSQSSIGNVVHDEDSHSSMGSASTTSIMDSASNVVTSHVTSRQYKCMANGCKFTSRVPVAMSDHLRFHERRSFSHNQDYFACAFCAYQADDVEGYMKHSDQYHIITKGNKPSATTLSTLNEPNSTVTSMSLTGRICDILSKKMETTANRSTVLLQQDVQKVDSAKPKESEEVYLKKLRATIEEIVGPTGLSDDKLYRCVVKNCTTPLTEATFHNHIMYHISTLGISNPNSYVYKCPHCTAQYHRPAGIKAHIKNHARNRYFCYMCEDTSSNPMQMKKHFSENHWQTFNMYTKELLKAKVIVAPDGSEKIQDSSYYVTYSSELSDAEVRKYGEKLILEWQRKKSGSKTHFKSSEIDLLPIQPIFQRTANCGECEYKTKVRTNMYRHLLMHKQFAQQPNNRAHTLVASVDPVNPVPCLNSNERFFDKMTNLASSSLIPSISANTSKTAYKLPHAFILDENRYRCGVPNCTFFTTSEVVFRAHVTTVHSSDSVFRCPFCQEEICKRGVTVDRILNHLRFHSSILHRCGECNYVHHLRFVVERHANEKHSTMKVNLVRHERTEEMGEGTMTVTSFAGKKYKDTSDTNQSQANTSSTNTSASSKCSNSADSATKSSNSTSSNAKSKSKWICDLCNHKASSLAQIQYHCQHIHGQNKPYQCRHCNFGSQQLSQILYHIDENHSGKTREARYIYHKSTNNNEVDMADTRPLWQRDDPTRVRHIRGILMENEEESEKHRKRMELDKVVDDDEEEKEDLVDVDNANLSNLVNFLKGYEFGCFHCDHKTDKFDDLFAVHHKNIHNFSLTMAKPFMFRLLRRVCCPECRNFSGNFYEMQLHLLNSHNVRNYYAADVNIAEHEGTTQKLKCGYCDFHCLKTDQLQKHFLSPKVQHSPLDVCIQNGKQINDVLGMGTKQTYYRCGLCTELLSTRVSVDQHANQLHANDERFSFTTLSNTLIYHCALCSYNSTTECALLRHMIDHYGRFKRCHFCHESQVSFEGYMQHCYAEHRDDIRNFRDIYPYDEIRKFLLQMFILFPNGLVISKKNLLHTKTYGDEEAMTKFYEEIYKISQQPPIPRLSIARLVARKSIEACHKPVSVESSNQHLECGEEANYCSQPSPQPTTSSQAKKITKRRITVALGQDDETGLSVNQSADKINIKRSSSNIKKRKPSLVVEQDSSSNQSSEFNVPLAYAMRVKKRRRTVATDPNENSQSPFSPVSTPQPPTFSNEGDSKCKRSKTDGGNRAAATLNQKDVQYFSYYGIKPEPLDLSKIYTKVAIGGINTPLTIDKFRLFFNIDCRLRLTKCDVSNIPTYTQYKHIKKACPASQKLRFF